MSAKQLPTTYGKSVIERKLGEGGMGTVYLGRHQSLGIPVAIKVLPEYLTMKDPIYAQRFAREARLSAKLRHPNIVSVMDYGIEGRHHYLVMEYIAGLTCNQKVEREKKLIWPEAVKIVRQVADGLGYAAKKGIIHRDVSPANILLDNDGVAHIADLGLAREITVDPKKVRLTRTGTSLGTPYYASPEQIVDASTVDSRSDIYSLGVTFYYLVCGKVPYTGTAFEVMAKHVQAPLPSPKEHELDLPDAVCDVIKKMVAKKPEGRYQSYEELCQDLDRLLKEAEVSAAGCKDESMVLKRADAAQLPDEKGSGEVAMRSSQKTAIVVPERTRGKLIVYIVAAAVAVAAAVVAILLRG